MKSPGGAGRDLGRSPEGALSARLSPLNCGGSGFDPEEV